MQFAAGRIGLLAALLILTPIAPGQEEGGSLREIKVQEILQAAKGASIPQIWGFAEQLSSLGPSAKRAIQRGLRDASVEGRLAGLKALIDLDSPTFAAEKLSDVARDEAITEQLRVAAIELLGQTDEEDAEDGLLELLLELNPRVKIAAARALWRLGTPRSSNAKKALREFLRSSDVELRTQGTLALAEMGDGDTPGVKQNLIELRKRPDMVGRLADALYHKLNLQRVIQRQEAREDAGGNGRASARWRHLDEVYALLKRFYEFEEEIDEDDLRIRAARGLLNMPADPHTQFLTPAEYEEFLHGNSGVDPSYGGIGAFIDTNVKDSFRILRPIFGGPAWNSDIRGGDDIVAVNGNPTAGRSTTDIIKDVKGPPGTPVVLSIYRTGWDKAREIKVLRAKIVLPTVFSRMLPGKIGYISVAQFAYETGKELRKHMGELEGQGMQGLILDLRDNPGGLLGSVKECLSPFLKERELVSTLRGRFGGQQEHFASNGGQPRAYPISVLVNERSASGAELMSGVLQHYSTRSEIGGAEKPYVDAVVIGVPTFGKGTVQQTRTLGQTWPGEAFQDVPRRNGYYDGGERYTDVNKNRRWDPGEPFQDLPGRNGQWDAAEPWVEKNGNGKRDEDEDFTDDNKDGVWNPAEKFTDRNGNGKYDHGAAVKLSIARYYLPGGKNFTRTRVYENGRYTYKGGVEPDIKLPRDRMDISRLVELRELQDDGVFRKYLDQHWNEHKAALRVLALYDGRDTSRYPEFDAFYTGLRTRLSRQHVRRALRIEIRLRVSNEQGKEILGDLSDDNVLLRGVFEALKRVNVDPKSIEEYRAIADKLQAK